MSFVKPFMEFKCSIHGFGWVHDCEQCIAVFKARCDYWGIKDKLEPHKGNYLFPICSKCGRRYAHDMTHTGVSIFAPKRNSIYRLLTELKFNNMVYHPFYHHVLSWKHHFQVILSNLININHRTIRNKSMKLNKLL